MPALSQVYLFVSPCPTFEPRKGPRALGAAYNALVGLIDRFAAVTAVPKVVKAAFVGGVVGPVAWFEPMLVGGGDPLIQAALGAPLSISSLLVVGAV